EPWLEDPPLYHWLALAFAKVFGGLLGLHNAVRLASGLAMLTALWFLYLAARHSALPSTAASRTESVAARRDAASDVAVRRGAGAAATLLLVGAIGLVVHAHEAVPDLATLAASCAAFAFLLQSNKKKVR